MQNFRGATLIYGFSQNHTLSRIPTYPRQLTYANTSQNTLPQKQLCRI